MGMLTGNKDSRMKTYEFIRKSNDWEKKVYLDDSDLIMIGSISGAITIFNRSEIQSAFVDGLGKTKGNFMFTVLLLGVGVTVGNVLVANSDGNYNGVDIYKYINEDEMDGQNIFIAIPHK